MKDQNFDLDFDQMVEALEDNEDMVECKECFDLFPKADCTRLGHAYICPSCRRPKSEPDIDFRTITSDLYTQEFPDIADYAPGTTKDWEAEPTISDALDDLIKDEYEAIDGYEVADEIVQHSRISFKRKEQILDTLDHIKKEEEEHIDELKALATEDEESVEEVEGAKERLTEAYVPAEGRAVYYAHYNFEIELGYIEAASEQEAYDIAVDHFGIFYHPEDIYVEQVSAEELEELTYEDIIGAGLGLTEGTQLTEAEVGKSREFFDKVAKAAKKGFRKFTKASINIDELFSGGYRIVVEAPKPLQYTVRKQPVHGQTAKTLNAAEQLIKAVAQAHAEDASATFKLMVQDMNPSIDDPNIKKIISDAKGLLIAYTKGKPKEGTNAIEKINKRLQKLEMANRTFDSTSAGVDMDFIKDGLKKILGAKKSADPYTEDSWNAYSEAYDKLLAEIDKLTDPAAVEEKNFEERIGKLAGMLEAKIPAEEDAESGVSATPKKDPTTLTNAAVAVINKIFVNGYLLVKTPEDEGEAPKVYSKNFNTYTDAFTAAKKLSQSEDAPRVYIFSKPITAEDLKQKNVPNSKSIITTLEKIISRVVNEQDTGVTGEKAKTSGGPICLATIFDNMRIIDETSNLPRLIGKIKALENLISIAADEDEDETDVPGDDQDNDVDPGDGDESQDNDDDLELDVAKKSAIKTIRNSTEKPDGYTEESYKTYTELVQKLIDKFNGITSMKELQGAVEKLPAFLEKLKQLLDPVTSDDKDTNDESNEDTKDLTKVKDELADKVLDTLVSSEGYTPESYKAYEAYVEDIVEKIEKAATKEDLDKLDAINDAEGAKKLLVKADADKKETKDEENTSEETSESEETETSEGGKLKKTGRGEELPPNTGGNNKAYDKAMRPYIQTAVNAVKKLIHSSGLRTKGDAELWVKKFIDFLSKKHRSEFVFEAYKRKFFKECQISEDQRTTLSEGLTKVFREAWDDDFEEETVTCVWCHEDLPISECRKEVDLGYLCSYCVEILESRGEVLTFEENFVEGIEDHGKILSDLNSAADELNTAVSKLNSI